MYVKVGTIEEPRKLAELAHLCQPKESELGYATTDCTLSTAIYRPHFRSEVVGDWVQCKLAIVWPFGCIQPHVDADVRNKRYLVVLQSNSHSWSLHDGAWQVLEEGGIYEMEPDKEHAAVNLGMDVRVHLVVDVKEENGREEA